MFLKFSWVINRWFLTYSSLTWNYRPGTRIKHSPMNVHGDPHGHRYPVRGSCAAVYSISSTKIWCFMQNSTIAGTQANHECCMSTSHIVGGTVARMVKLKQRNNNEEDSRTQKVDKCEIGIKRNSLILSSHEISPCRCAYIAVHCDYQIGRR